MLKILKFILNDFKRIFFRLINNIQKYLLGDDILSIIIRMILLRIIGIKAAYNAKILADCDILGSNLHLGKRAFINRRCYFDLKGRVTIEDNVGIGHGVTFITSDHKIGPENNRAGHIVKGCIHSQDITLKTGSWVGANVTIMPGVIIGKGTVVATGSIVTKDVPDNVIVAGIPAKIIKTLEKN